MRIMTLLLPVLLFSAVGLSAVDGQDSKTASRKFGGEVVVLLKWYNERMAANRGNVKGYADQTAEFVKKIGELNVDGLPEDLRARVQELAAAARDVHSGFELARQYAAAEAKEGGLDPAKRADLQTKKRAALDRYGAATSGLTAALAKHAFGAKD
jgi:hypothetical protein